MRFALIRFVGLFGIVLALLAPRNARAEADTFGTGNAHNGSVVYAGGGPINASTKLTAVNGTVLTVASTTGFTKSDLVMLWQTAGLTPPTSGSQTAVSLTGTGVGTYE